MWKAELERWSFLPHPAGWWSDDVHNAHTSADTVPVNFRVARHTNESAKNKSQVIVLVLGIWLDFGHSHPATGVEIEQLNGEFDPGSG